jgi:hypothetical protein
MGRKKKEEPQEEPQVEVVAEELNVEADLGNVSFKFAVFGQIMNDALLALQSTQPQRDEDPYLKSVREDSEDSSKIKREAQALILRVFKEYNFVLDHPQMYE